MVQYMVPLFLLSLRLSLHQYICWILTYGTVGYLGASVDQRAIYLDSLSMSLMIPKCWCL